MTPTEVLSEIRKMPLTEQRQLLVELIEQLSQIEQFDLDDKEKGFTQSLLQKGLISEVPLRLPDDEFRKHFKLIEVKGEPLSETIIKERS